MEALNRLRHKNAAAKARLKKENFVLIGGQRGKDVGGGGGASIHLSRCPSISLRIRKGQLWPEIFATWHRIRRRRRRRPG